MIFGRRKGKRKSRGISNRERERVGVGRGRVLVVVVAIWAGMIEEGAGGGEECGKGFGGWGGRNMDTPDKIIPSSSLSSNFEDSPVFNYISNLSPIKPFKSQISHSFQSLNFAPVPSVFASPQAISFNEAKSWKRGDFLKASTVEDTSEDKDVAQTALLEVKLPDCSADALGSCDAGPSTVEALQGTTSENSSSFLPTLAESFENEYNSPDNTPSRTTKASLGIKTFDTPKFDMCFHKEGIQQVDNTVESDINLRGVYPLGLPEDDWDNLISDNSNLFTFDSSIPADASRMQDCKLEETSLASFVTKFQVDNVSHQQEVHGGTSSSHRLSWLQDSAFYSARLGEPDTASCRPIIFPCRQNVGDNGNMEHDEPVDRLEVTDVDSAQSDSKVHNQQLRIMRRRCLVFDTVGVFSKSMEDGLKCNSAATYQSDGALDDRTLGPYKHGVSSSPCMVPGIGLHLNTLATTSKNCKVVKQEILSSGKRIISMPRSVTSVSSLTAVQKSIAKRLMLSPVGKGISPTCEDIQVTELNVQLSELGAEDDSMQNSPTKKKRRMELEDEGCKRCNCKKSKCLKLYCECFAAGVYCVEPCSCIDCYNKPIHEDTVLSTRRQIESRNPLAFAPKVIWQSETLPDMAVEDTNMTPASARHKRGCNCKKSSCNKKYCECFQGGVGCSNSCRCEGCKNSYGVKGLTLCSIVEVEPEEDDFPSLAKEGIEQRLTLKEVQKDGRHLIDTHYVTTTPFSACRTLLKLPSSSRKLPRSSLQSAGPIKKHCTKNSKIKLDDNFADSLEDETPGFLNDSVSPFTGVKNLSPNSKRVSPHNHNVSLGMSPGMRSSRSLILQSIPSIPPQ